MTTASWTLVETANRAFLLSPDGDQAEQIIQDTFYIGLVGDIHCYSFHVEELPDTNWQTNGRFLPCMELYEGDQSDYWEHDFRIGFVAAFEAESVLDKSVQVDDYYVHPQGQFNLPVANQYTIGIGNEKDSDSGSGADCLISVPATVPRGTGLLVTFHSASVYGGW